MHVLYMHVERSQNISVVLRNAFVTVDLFMVYTGKY